MVKSDDHLNDISETLKERFQNSRGYDWALRVEKNGEP